MKHFVLAASVAILFACSQEPTTISFESENPINLDEAYRYSDTTDVISILIPDSSWKPTRVLNQYSPSMNNDYMRFLSGVLIGNYDDPDSTLYILNAGYFQYGSELQEDLDVESELEQLALESNTIESGVVTIGEHEYIYSMIDSSFDPELYAEGVVEPWREYSYFLYEYDHQKHCALNISLAVYMDWENNPSTEEVKDLLNRLIPIVESLEIDPDFKGM